MMRLYDKSIPVNEKHKNLDSLLNILSKLKSTAEGVGLWIVLLMSSKALPESITLYAVNSETAQWFLLSVNAFITQKR